MNKMYKVMTYKGDGERLTIEDIVKATGLANNKMDVIFSVGVSNDGADFYSENRYVIPFGAVSRLNCELHNDYAKFKAV